MDNVYIRDGYLIDIVDKDWMLDKIPHADVSVPIDELPGDHLNNFFKYFCFIESLKT